MPDAQRRSRPNETWSGASTPLRVLVDGPSMTAAAYRALLDTLPGFSPATPATPTTPARNASEPRPPMDLLLLLATDTADLGPLEAIGRRYPGVPIVWIAAAWSAPDAQAVLQAGAAGCLSATAGIEELVAALRQAARGEIALSADVARALIDRLARQTPEPSAPAEHLSPREREVLLLVCEGLSNKQIAQRLYLSLRTVENHLAAVYAKLGAGSRTEAAVLAVRLGWTAEPAVPGADGTSVPAPNSDATSTRADAAPSARATGSRATSVGAASAGNPTPISVRSASAH